jgi:hypothetical protein
LTEATCPDDPGLYAETPELAHHRTVLQKQDNPVYAGAASLLHQVHERQFAAPSLLGEWHHNGDL